MGARGPKPKPLAQKIAEGNPGKEAIVNLEIVRLHGAPYIPAHLSEDAQECVRIILNDMPDKMLSRLDVFALSAFATACAWHKAATEEINRPDFEPIVETKMGMIPNPWFKILDKQAQVMLSWASKLYLTPADRAFLLKRNDQPETPSKFAGLIEQTASYSLSKP